MQVRIRWVNFSEHNRVSFGECQSQRRIEQLAQERSITATAPVIRGGLVVIPQGLLNKHLATTEGVPTGFAESAASRREIEVKAMNAVMEAEQALGNTVSDVSAQKVGYDILSFDPKSKNQRFIEVKGRIDSADTVMVTRNEIITSLNKPEDYILAIVQVSAEFVHEPRYIWRPFEVEPAFGVTAQQFKMKHLLDRSEPPR